MVVLLPSWLDLFLVGTLSWDPCVDTKFHVGYLGDQKPDAKQGKLLTVGIKGTETILNPSLLT